MSHIFISYSTQNSKYAYKLADHLRNAGFDVWVDNARLRSSDDWWESIVRALRECSAFIVVMTPESRKSKWVQREVTLADNWHKPMFPVLLAGDNWEIFVRTQYEDVRSEVISRIPPQYEGNLPDSEFISTLADHVLKSGKGVDITGKKIPSVGDTDLEVVAAIAAPPPKDKEFVKKIDGCLTRPIISIIIVPLIIGLIAALAPNFITLINSPTSEPTEVVLVATEISSDIPIETPFIDTPNISTTEPPIMGSATPEPTSMTSHTPIPSITPSLTATPTAPRTPSPSDIITSENVGNVVNIGTLFNVARVNDMVFTSDGNFIATVDLDNDIKIWSIFDANVVSSWRQIGVLTLAISPDGTLIAGGGTDNMIYIWELTTGRLVKTLQGHTAAVSDIAFNPTCANVLFCDVGLVSGSFDNHVRLWNIDTGNSEVLNGHVNPVVSIAFNPNGRSITSGSYGGSLIEWNIATRRQVDTLQGHSGTVSTIAYSNSCVDINGTCIFLMASAGEDRRILIWNATTGEQILELRNTHTANINSVAFSPDGSLLATASSDFTIRIIDIRLNRELSILNSHTSVVMNVLFSPNGQLIASSSTDQSIKTWGVEK